MSTAVTGNRKTEAAMAAYGRLRAAHLSMARAALEDHVARLEWPREQIERYRDQRLRACLAYARERSPFYAARIGDLDISAATVSDLARLPLLTKQEVQDHWDTIVTAPGLNREMAERILARQAWYSYTPAGEQVFSSGGSTGVRGVYVWDWDMFVTIACLAWRSQLRDERRGPSPLGPQRLAVLEAGHPPHAGTPLFDVPVTPGMETTVIPAGEPFDQVLAAVAAARPTQLVGFPSVMARLARAALAGDLEIRPVRVSTNSEPLVAEDRNAIRAAWDVPVHNLWGSTEVGVQAVGCARGDGLHVCEDEVVLERVDKSGLPVGPDEPAARTLVTGLSSRTFPFIRYDLGDEVTVLPGRCPCGSRFARLAEIEGRVDDDFRYRDITVPARVFRHALGGDPGIIEYQVLQTPAGAEIHIVGSPDVAALSASVPAVLRDHGLPEPRVRIRTVDRLQRHEATGKLRRFVPLPDDSRPR